MTSLTIRQPARTGQDKVQPRTKTVQPSASANPLAGIIANAAENQRRREEEKRRREREAREARARFALD